MKKIFWPFSDAETPLESVSRFYVDVNLHAETSEYQPDNHSRTTAWHCLLAAWPDDSPARDDVAAASRALHYMGQVKPAIQ